MAAAREVSSVMLQQTSHNVSTSLLSGYCQGLLTDLLTSWNTFIGHFWPPQDNRMVKRLLDLFLVGSISKEVAGAAQCAASNANASQIDLGWHAPNATIINDLSSVINGTGVYGFIFNSSLTPATSGYSTYNWCNMPHVRPQEYVVPPSEFKLEYVEVVGNHTISYSVHLFNPDSYTVLEATREMPKPYSQHLRSTGTTNAPRTRPTHSHARHTHGRAPTPHCSTTARRAQTGPPRRSTGK